MRKAYQCETCKRFSTDEEAMKVHEAQPVSGLELQVGSIFKIIEIEKVLDHFKKIKNHDPTSGYFLVSEKLNPTVEHHKVYQVYFGFNYNNQKVDEIAKIMSSFRYDSKSNSLLFAENLEENIHLISQKSLRNHLQIKLGEVNKKKLTQISKFLNSLRYPKHPNMGTIAKVLNSQGLFNKPFKFTKGILQR